jgi:hypothetical protein
MPIGRLGCCRNLAAGAALTGMLKQTDEQRARAERIFKAREAPRVDAPQAAASNARPSVGAAVARVWEHYEGCT